MEEAMETAIVCRIGQLYADAKHSVPSAAGRRRRRACHSALARGIATKLGLLPPPTASGSGPAGRGHLQRVRDGLKLLTNYEPFTAWLQQTTR